MNGQVLIVDDDADARALGRRILEREGYDVAEACDGLDALAQIARSIPDVIVMDAVMPNLDGLECTRRLKDDPTTWDVPVIMVSARTNAEDIDAGLDAGVDEYLTKPFTRTEFALRVRSMARSRQSRAELAQSNSELQEIQQRLVDASRQAGMAETVTEVLHNVGNVLNSINVSTALVGDKIRGSRVSGLARATKLMSEHADDLGTFLTQDERGRQLPGYLTKLAEYLANEQSGVLSELRYLSENIEHIKNIIAVQQSVTGVSGLTEPVRVGDLLEDLLRMDASSLDRRGIKVAREYEEISEVATDKHRLVQILVNLLKNAKEALAEGQAMDKRLTVRLRALEQDRVQIEVADTGAGISPENLTQIFTHGFTTKEEGHGYGLHSCAVTAKDLGGSLTAHSEGLGQGATFTLTLPQQHTEPSHVCDSARCTVDRA